MDYDIGIVRRRRIISADDCYFAVPPPSGWTPASLTNLLGWYKADGTLLNGSSNPAVNNDLLSQWNDESGHGNHLLAQNISAFSTGKYLTAGLNSKKTVSFLSSNSATMLTAATVALGGTKGSCYLYGSVPSTATAFRYIAAYAAPAQGFAGTNGCAWVQLSSPTTTIAANSGGFKGTGTIANDTGTRFGSIFDGTNSTVAINGVLQTGSQAAASPTFTTGGRFAVSGDSDVPNGTDSFISEIVVTASDLSGGELALLDTWMTRWN